MTLCASSDVALSSGVASSVTLCASSDASSVSLDKMSAFCVLPIAVSVTDAAAKVAAGNRLKSIAKLNAAANRRFFTCLMVSPSLSKNAV